jgi:ribose 5-phosphate isomerase A
VSRAKQAAGEYAARLVEPGWTVGLGTGSTAAFLVKALGRRVREEGLDFRGIPTSTATRELALSEGLTLVSLDEVATVDLTIDGADEIDPALALIKGGGGALLWEKIVASASRELVVIADAAKLVRVLGHFPLPIEVVPTGWTHVRERVRALGAEVMLRKRADESPFVTDGGHYIIDAWFKRIAAPAALASELDRIVGVVEHGLFVGLAQRALIGQDDGAVVELGPL